MLLLIQQKMQPFSVHFCAGCAVDMTRANGFVRAPLFENNTVYPPSVTCTYVIRAPQDAQRTFQLFFNESQLADAADYVKVLVLQQNQMWCITSDVCRFA